MQCKIQCKLFFYRSLTPQTHTHCEQHRTRNEDPSEKGKRTLWSSVANDHAASPRRKPCMSFFSSSLPSLLISAYLWSTPNCEQSKCKCLGWKQPGDVKRKEEAEDRHLLMIMMMMISTTAIRMPHICRRWTYSKHRCTNTHQYKDIRHLVYSLKSVHLPSCSSTSTSSLV